MSDDYIDPETIGHWEGSAFVFDQHQKVWTDDGREVSIKSINIEGMVLGEGVTALDVLHALVNPIAIARDDDPPLPARNVTTDETQ